MDAGMMERSNNWQAKHEKMMAAVKASEGRL